MFSEALEIIRRLFDGGDVNFAGEHYRVDSAKLWDLPERRVPVATAVSGDQSIERFAPVADAMIATQPEETFCSRWDEVANMTGSRKIGQLPIAWDVDRDAAAQRAYEQFRWFAGGWKVNAEIPAPSGFEAATQFVRSEDVTASIPCGPEVEPIVYAVSAFWQAGFTDVALVQIGVDKDPHGFFRFAEHELLPALRNEIR